MLNPGFLSTHVLLLPCTRYNCADCADAEEFYDKYGEDYWMTDLEDYDKKCKVEPLMRAMKEADTDAWINGRRCCTHASAPP